MEGRTEPQTQPRWGNVSRDRKALAIWDTLVGVFGDSIGDGAWLDVGCGSGGIAIALADKVKSIVGVDPEPWSEWQSARLNIANIDFVPATFDGTTPPICENSIHVLICNQVYEHVGDPVALIRNISRVLAPGGVGYFAGPNQLWPIEPHVFWPFVHWLPRPIAHRAMRLLGSRRPEDLDAFSTTYWTLTGWLRSAGLEVESAIKPRIVAGIRQSRFPGLAVVAAAVPDFAYRLASPFAPGFVFAIRKAP